MTKPQTKKPWDWYKPHLAEKIEQAADAVFSELRYGQPVFLYFKPTDGKTWGEFAVVRDEGQNRLTVPEGFQPIMIQEGSHTFMRPFRSSQTKAQIRYWIEESVRRLPLIPND